MLHSRLDRISRLPQVSEAVFHSLSRARILVVGAGGLGVPVLMYLANSGIRHIGICEEDIVAESNLHRQVAYTLQDCGNSKSGVIYDFMIARNPELEIMVHPYLIRDNALSIISRYDIVMDGCDNFGTRYLVNDACFLLGKPLVSGSVFQYEGQIGVWNAALSDGRRSTNYRDIFPEMPDTELPDCNAAGVNGPLCGVIGSLMAQEALKLAGMPGKILTDTLCIFDSFLNTWQHVAVQENELNPVRITHALQDQYIIRCATSGEVTWDELEVWNAEGRAYLLIDVRTEEEYTNFNVGGLSVPLSCLESRISELPADRPWIFVCQSGLRSARALSLAEAQQGNQMYPPKHIKGGLNSR